MSEGERKKGSSKGRAARLEAELRANLKKRKEQAKARARTTGTKDTVREEGDEYERLLGRSNGDFDGLGGCAADLQHHRSRADFKAHAFAQPRTILGARVIG